MKKNRLLFLLPALGLFLSGCENPFAKKDQPGQQEEVKTLSSIAVSGSYKTEYVVGDVFDKSGIVVTATYSDSSTSNVSSQASFSGFSSEAAGEVSVSVSFGGKTSSFTVSVVQGISFAEISQMFARAGIEGTVPGIPSAEGVAEYYGSGSYGIEGLSETELEAFVEALKAAGWEVEGEEGYYEGSYGERVSFYIFDFFGMMYMAGFRVAPAIVESFPASAVESFFAEKEISVVVPATYAIASEEAAFELDNFTDEKYVVIYADLSTAEELATYKDSLVEAGWVVVGEDGTDFSLQYGETNAYASLVYMDETQVEEGEPVYASIVFYVYTPAPAPETATELMEFIGETEWGYIEEDDFNEPDEDGIVTSNWTIKFSELENPEDSEECLAAVFEGIADDLSEYLAPYGEPDYTANAIDLDNDETPDVGVSEIFFVTEDSELVSYMYAYYDNDGSVIVVFEAGPASAYFGE